MLSGTPAPSSNRTCRFPAYGSPCGSLYSSLPFPEPFQYRFTLVTTASFNLDKRFAARRIICGLPPLTALSGNIFLILMSFAFLFHAEALRTPARASLRDSLSLGGYPRSLPASPLLRPHPTTAFASATRSSPKFPCRTFETRRLLCPAALTLPKSSRRGDVGFTNIEALTTRKHLTRLYVGSSLALRLVSLSGKTPAHRSPSARLAVLIVCRFLYDIAPSAISSAELCLAYLCQ